MSHIWSTADIPIRVMPLARQPEHTDVPLHALAYGAFYAAIGEGTALPELDVAIRRGTLTGLVAIASPRCYRVYVEGKCTYESTSEACAYAELAAHVERPGILARLACWLWERHDAGTASRLAAAAAGLGR